jgi:hypothetical protein
MWTLIGAILIAAAPSSDVPVLRADVRPDGRLEPSEWAGAREIGLEGMRWPAGRARDSFGAACAAPSAPGDRGDSFGAAVWCADQLSGVERSFRDVEGGLASRNDR